MQRLLLYFRYCKTVGLAGKFTSTQKRNHYIIKLKGKLYNEVEDAEITLKTEQRSNPENFEFQVTSLSSHLPSTNSSKVLTKLKSA